MRWATKRTLRILDIDTECLPGHWIGGDYVSKILTAVAWKWVGEDEAPHVLTHYQHEPGEMAAEIATQIMLSDLVVGHFIRGFDLRLINGNLLRSGFHSIDAVRTHDTKLDLKNAGGRSLSQKNLASTLGIQHPKIEVTLHEWEMFNQKQPGWEEKGADRVAGDVEQNIELYQRLKEIRWLEAPKTWTPTSFGGRYHA